MQQRYYDPIAGRFLSVDPVVTDANTGKGFGLYTYAFNNPYIYIDPDGRVTYALYPLSTTNINTIVTDGKGGIRVYLGGMGDSSAVVVEGANRHENEHKDQFYSNCEDTCGIITSAPANMGIGVIGREDAANLELGAIAVEINYLTSEAEKGRNRAIKPEIEERIRRLIEYRDKNKKIADEEKKQREKEKEERKKREKEQREREQKQPAVQ